MSVTGRVLAEVGSGAATVAEVAVRTGLDRDVVAMAVDRLVAAGRLGSPSLASACPPAGCGACGSCGSGGPGVAERPGCRLDARASGPVLLPLGVRRS